MMAKPGIARHLIKVSILFIAYFVTARIGLSFDAVSGFATLVWPPTGISIAALLLFGLDMWPGVFIGAFLANLATGASVPVALGIGIGNTLEAFLAAYFLRYLIDFDTSVSRLKDGFLIIFVSLVSAVVSATLGVSALFFGGVVLTPSAFLATWQAWWIGDILGALIITPLLLAFYHWWQKRSSIKLKPVRIFELNVLIILLLSASLMIFGNIIPDGPRAAAFTYILFVPVVWGAVRFGNIGATTSIFLLSVVAVWATSEGSGPFYRGDLRESLTYLQIFMGVLSGITLILSSSLASRREKEITITEPTLGLKEKAIDLKQLAGSAISPKILSKLGVLSNRIIFLSLIVPMIILALYSYWTTRDNLRAEIFNRYESKVEIFNTLVKTKLDEIKDMGKAYAEDSEFRQLIVADKWQEAGQFFNFDNIQKDFYFIENIALIEIDGTAKFVVPQTPNVIGQSFSHRDWYQAFIKNQQFYLSGIFKRAVPRPGSTDLNSIVLYVFPIKDDHDMLIGILTIAIDLNFFESLIEQIGTVERGEFTYIVDQTGKLVYHPKYDFKNNLIDFSSISAVKKLAVGERGVEIEFDPKEQEDRLAAYAPIFAYGWGVVDSQSTQAAFAEMNKSLRVQAILYSVFFFFYLALLYFLSLLFDRVLTQKKLLDTDVEALKKVENQLIDQNKNLEQIVVDRTKDLEDKISDLEKLNRFMVGRELRMIELKDKNKDIRVSLLKRNHPKRTKKSN